MLSYDDKIAEIFHSLPMVLALGLPLLLHPSTATATRSMKAECSALTRNMLTTVCSILLTVGLPALLGGVRSAASGD
jgi:hypothetical protein